MFLFFLLVACHFGLVFGQKDAKITTNITQDKDEVTITNNNEEAVRAFKAALPMSETTVDDKDIEPLATRLVRYDGCDNFQANHIYSGWQQSWKIMEASKNGDIDFNSAAALEFLGASGLNKDKHDAMNALFKNLNTIQPRYIPIPFDWRLHVRCDDPIRRCTCNAPGEKSVYAYTTNKDADSGLARINFCPLYFKTSTLPSIVKFMKKETDKSFKFDIDQYHDSQAHVWIHELLHIDWVSQARGYGSNEHIHDLKVSFFPSNGGPEREQKAYLGRNTKILARWPEDTGKYVMKNADSVAIYALAHYIQGQIDGYPLYPLVNEEPSDAPHLFVTKDNQVKLNMDNSDAKNWPNAGGQSCDDDEDQPKDDTVVKIDTFAPDSAYPSAYLQSIRSAAPTKPTDPPAGERKDESNCHGVSGDFWVMHRDTAVKNAEDFCKQSSKSVEYNKDSVDHLRLSVEFPEDDKKGPGDAPNCRDNFVNAVIDGCDGNDKLNNPHNYKFGSTFALANGWVFKMEPLSKQVNELSCDVSYRFFFNGFEIRGKNWPDAKLGANGEGLEKELKGCGALTEWKFGRTPDDVKFHWLASGQLPIGTKNCVGDAARTAGAAGEGNCHGAGKRSRIFGRTI